MNTGYKLTVHGEGEEIVLRYENVDEFNTMSSITFKDTDLKNFVDEIVSHMKATYEHE